MSTDSPVNAPLPQRFDVVPYTSDGGATLAGLLQLASILCSVGILLGLIIGFVSQWIYLIVIFPLLMGALVGWVGKKTIERYKIRRPMTCAIAGFAAGCLCFLTMHYCEYLIFESHLDSVPVEVRNIARHFDQAAAEGQNADEWSRDVIKRLRDDPKMLETLQVDGFPDYMELQARHGVTISEVGKGGNGLNLGYVGSYIYWCVEAVLLALIALGIMKQAAGLPFCVDCHSWKTDSPLIEVACTSKDIEAAVRQGDLAELERTITAPDPKKIKAGQSTKILTCVCANCESPQTMEVKVSRVSIVNGQKAEGVALMVSYPIEALDPLHEMVARITNPART